MSHAIIKKWLLIQIIHTESNDCSLHFFGEGQSAGRYRKNYFFCKKEQNPKETWVFDIFECTPKRLSAITPLFFLSNYFEICWKEQMAGKPKLNFKLLLPPASKHFNLPMQQLQYLQSKNVDPIISWAMYVVCCMETRKFDWLRNKSAGDHSPPTSFKMPIEEFLFVDFRCLEKQKAPVYWSSTFSSKKCRLKILYAISSKIVTFLRFGKTLAFLQIILNFGERKPFSKNITILCALPQISSFSVLKKINFFNRRNFFLWNPYFS